MLEGRFTLDIYLLQIVIVEIIGSHLYKIWLNHGGIDVFYLGGYRSSNYSLFSNMYIHGNHCVD